MKLCKKKVNKATLEKKPNTNVNRDLSNSSWVFDFQTVLTPQFAKLNLGFDDLMTKNVP
jgi:hypothetical protein